MGSARWQWNDYRYCREHVRWLLTHFKGDVAQLRLLRGQLRRFARLAKQRDISFRLRHFVYALAIIERSSVADRLSLELERQAIQCLFASGIKPPKSQLSGLFVDLFQVRIHALQQASISSPLTSTVSHRITADTLVLYQLLCQYCVATDPITYPMTLPARYPAISTVRQTLDGATRQAVPSSGNRLQTLRRYRFSGQLALAQQLASESSDANTKGEALLIDGQRKGYLVPVNTVGGCPLNCDQWGEWWLLAYAVASRRWLTKRPEPTCVSPPVWRLLDLLHGFYRYETPLLQRLYHYVRFRLEDNTEDPLLSLYMSAACLRWLFRANQRDFAHQEAQRYQTLSRVISRETTVDALGVMADVFKRLYPPTPQ